MKWTIILLVIVFLTGISISPQERDSIEHDQNPSKPVLNFKPEINREVDSIKRCVRSIEESKSVIDKNSGYIENLQKKQKK